MEFFFNLSSYLSFSSIKLSKFLLFNIESNKLSLVDSPKLSVIVRNY